MITARRRPLLGDRHAWPNGARPIVLIAVLTVVMLACAGVGATGARADKLVTITIPDPQGYIPTSLLTYPGGVPRADVLLPTGYSPKKTYPLIVLLPGFSNTYAILGPGMLDAQKVIPNLQAIVISPEGEVGWYADWYNNGAYGKPDWESYELDDVIPYITSHYRILPGRQYHALFGVSMGGLGAAYLGGRLPSFFGSIGILSGFVDTQISAPILAPLGMDALAGAKPGSVDGPGTGFYATGHNPTALVHNLQYSRVFMSAGNGIATPGEGDGGGVANAEEVIIRAMSDSYNQALVKNHIDVTFQTHTGCHCWQDFDNELLNAIKWNPFKPVVTDPANWVNSTVATHGELWDFGYQFGGHPSQVVTFTQTGSQLKISAAGTPVTITTAGGCVLKLSTPNTVQLPRANCAPYVKKAKKGHKK